MVRIIFNADKRITFSHLTLHEVFFQVYSSGESHSSDVAAERSLTCNNLCTTLFGIVSFRHNFSSSPVAFVPSWPLLINATAPQQAQRVRIPDVLHRVPRQPVDADGSGKGDYAPNY